MTTCLENLEMSGNLTVIREMSGILLSQGNGREVSGKNLVREKLSKTVYIAYLHPYRYLAGVCSVLNIKYIVSDHALLHSYPHH